MKRMLGIAMLLGLVVSGCAVGPATGSDPGSGYPERGISILAPGSTGGGWDTRARGMEDALTRCGVITQDVTVTNTPGAGGTIGLAAFVTKQGDPYQLMVMDTMTMLGGIVRNHSPIDLATLTPIAGLTESVGAILVPAGSTYTDLGTLLADMKADPQRVSWVGGSLGGPDHIAVAALADASGIPVNRINYVPTGGGGEATSLLLSGASTAGVGTLAEVKAQIAAGDLRVLAITNSNERVAGIDAPTLVELGYGAANLASRGGVLAPPGLTKEQQQAIVDMVAKMRDTDCWRETLRQNNWVDGWLPGDDFGRLIVDHRDRVTAILTQLGLTS
jgi:putative tricarboxylic transport membrane protein